MSAMTGQAKRGLGLLLALVGLAPLAGGAEIYSDLMRVFTNGEQRLPGGEAYERSFKELERALRSAGLDPRLQTFDTLAPHTERCQLSVGGAAVTPVFPLNQGVAALVTEKPVTGPLLWLGNGSLAAMEGKAVSGCVALLDFDDPAVQLNNVFAKGAKGVVLIGRDASSRWNVSQLALDGPIPIPCVYVSAEAAQRSQLRNSEGVIATFDVKSGLRDVVAHNLWVEIPGRTGTVFHLGKEEALVLSASLDTVGVIPDRCPGLRGAANAALLAEVLTSLATNRPGRSVVAVFWGACNWDQEAARYFYYALGAGSGLLPGESISNRLEFSRLELDRVERLLAVSEKADLLEARDPETLDFVQRLREKLVGLVNNANASLRLARLAQTEERESARSGEPAVRIPDRQPMIDALTLRKRNWNDLRERIARHGRHGEEGGEPAAYRETVDSVKRDLLLRRDELRRALVHLESSQELANRFAGKAVVAHFDFDFSNDRDSWLPSVLEDPAPFTSQNPAVGGLLLHLGQFGKIYRELPHPAGSASLLESALTPYYKPYALCVPVERSVPTSVGAMLGIPGFQLMTAGDSLATDEMPVQRACDLRGLIPQMTGLMGALADHEALSLRRPFPAEQTQEALAYRYEGGVTYQGLRSLTLARGSSDVEGPAGHALLRVELSNRPRTAGVNRQAVARINADGYVFMPMINRQVTRTRWLARLAAFGYDEGGRFERVSLDPPQGIESPRLPLFYKYGGAAFSYGLAVDPSGSELYTPRTLNARTDAPFRTFTEIRSSPLVAFYTDRPGRIKRIGGQGEILLGSTDKEPAGVGIPLDEEKLLNVDGPVISARDSWHLNESRLAALRKRGSINDDLETLHADAAGQLELAEKAARARSPRLQQAHSIFAACLENRVYGPLRGIADDLMRAVVLLLILSIPFALALERLVFGFTTIHKQVVGVTGFFLLTFGLLYITHPAFSLASAPIIVFLAFVIILLSAITIKLVLDKINKEIRAMQGLASKLHGREESGTVMAAILIGVSGMRNRPLKTLLTSVTIMLLTFTILAFASLTARMGVTSSDLGRGQDEDRIELHRFSYLPIAPELADAVAAIGEPTVRTFTRGWVFDRVAFNPANGKTASLGAILGVESGEAALNAKLGALAPSIREAKPGSSPLYLPASVAQKLEIAPGAELRVNGFPFVFAGSLDTAVLTSIETLDGMKLLPPDFESTRRNLGAETGAAMDPRALEELERGTFAWFSPDRAAIAEWSVLRSRFGSEASAGYLLMYPKLKETDLDKAAGDLARVFQGAVHVKTPAGVRKLFFTQTIEGSGFGEVIVPLLLGGLIIFSSLMGSIVDREKEIYTYSAMGLSPPSVGALFFAESAIYSVVGGMGGYLLGQLTAKIAAWLNAQGWCALPPLNFASLSSVLTIFVVMGVVLLSTLYPALKAGRSANPGVARRWKMPEPRGDRLDFVFPFTVSQADFVGILSFIREHFQNHADATLGSFAARNVRIVQAEPAAGGERRLGIEADISLAPFDLGVFQRFRMTSKEFEIMGVEEVVVELERVAGTTSAWRRANRLFADELREQFLLWRSLPIEAIEHYRRETEKADHV